MEFKGIDVSKWQGRVNWNEVKKDSTEFAIIREGWGKKSPTFLCRFKRKINLTQIFIRILMILYIPK